MVINLGLWMKRELISVLNTRIDALNWDSVLTRIQEWGRSHDSRYICICNVHSLVTASQDSIFRELLNEADMVTPDGAPIAWMLRCFGSSGQPRINGPDLMWEVCGKCASEGLSVYFYGSTENTLTALDKYFHQAFPSLVIGGLDSPPFRFLTATEDTLAVDRINASGAGIVFVGLGCPKQERWMAEHRGRVNAVMIGVGAAFDFHAGNLKRAPTWMRDNGLEWFHRLIMEPRRLWKRYLVTNTIFIVLVARQLFFGKR
jgi:N-acetylglucosaminyldiphosphoundecaprenol N-acetyl-beta-D-mannosaminyltransferase